MAILGVFVYTGIHAEWAGIEAETGRYYASSNMPDLWVYSSNFTVADVRSLNKLTGVSKAVRRLCIDGILFHYVSYGIWIGLSGGLIGLVAGPLVIPPLLFVMQRSIYDLPDWYSVLSLYDFLAPFWETVI